MTMGTKNPISIDVTWGLLQCVSSFKERKKKRNQIFHIKTRVSWGGWLFDKIAKIKLQARNNNNKNQCY